MNTATQILLAAILGLPALQAAVIDSFGSPQGVITDSFADGISVSNTLGNRTIWTNMTSGVGSTSIEIGGGLYLGNAGAMASGQSGVYYDGLWNLSALHATGLTLDIVDIEKYAGGSVGFFISQGSNTAAYSIAVPSVGTIIAGFDSFAGIGSIDLSGVDRLGFSFTHVNAQDIVIDNFGTQVVPEPGAYALTACGMLALGLVRRYRRRPRLCQTGSCAPSGHGSQLR